MCDKGTFSYLYSLNKQDKMSDEKHHRSIKLRYVVSGKYETSAGGLTKSEIKKVKHGDQVRYVSKAKHELGKENPWAKAVKKAYKQTDLGGEFVPLGKGIKGKKLLKTAREIYSTMV